MKLMKFWTVSGQNRRTIIQNSSTVDVLSNKETRVNQANQANHHCDLTEVAAFSLWLRSPKVTSKTTQQEANNLINLKGGGIYAKNDLVGFLRLAMSYIVWLRRGYTWSISRS